jgi:hypothetical protein
MPMKAFQPFLQLEKGSIGGTATAQANTIREALPFRYARPRVRLPAVRPGPCYFVGDRASVRSRLRFVA